MSVTRPDHPLRMNGRLLKCIGIVLCLYVVYDLVFYRMKLKTSCFATREERTAIIYLLEQFHQQCLQHEVTDFAIFGTLLGIYRYKSTIPWDADADIGFTKDGEEHMEKKVLPSLKLLKPGQISWAKIEPGKYIVNYDYASSKAASMDVFSYHRVQRPDGVYLERVYSPHDVYYQIVGSKPTKLESVLPTVACRIENTTIACPNNPEDVLQKTYRFTFRSGVKVPFKSRCYLEPWKLAHVLSHGKDRNE